MSKKEKIPSESRSAQSKGNVTDSASPDTYAEAPRRRTLKMLVAGGTIASAPASWRKPVVDSVVLPAHAQTSPSSPSPRGCGGGGPCTSGMNVNIIFAELVSGDLMVVGDTNIPDDQGCGLGPSDEDPMWTPPQLICALLDENGLITSTTFSSAGGGCNDDSATDTGCLVSCSIDVAEGDHSVESGDCITLRFTFAGGCVCSGVRTVS